MIWPWTKKSEKKKILPERQPPEKEQALQVGEWLGGRSSPQTSGAVPGFTTYRKMALDEQIRALLSLKQTLITSRSWRFIVDQQNPKQAKCARFFRFVLHHQLDGAVGLVLEDLLSAHSFGFSVLEKVYARVKWEKEEYWGLRAIKLRPAETFSFETDPFGNLTTLYQRQGSAQVPLVKEHFIFYVNKPQVHPQYGESDLRECFPHWKAKQAIFRLWQIYLERMASGFVHGRITGPLAPPEREELKHVMRNLGEQTSVITPASVELQMVSAPSTDTFERAVASRDKALAKALLVPNLLGFSEQGQTGSYSQSRVQLETFYQTINTLAERVADVLNEQLFRQLGWWNFGLKTPPLFAFDSLTESQKREFAKSWGEALRSGAVSSRPEDEERTRELLSYPQSNL